MTNTGATHPSPTPYSDALGITTPSTFAALMRATRHQHRLTVNEAAAKIGISRESLINWERLGPRGQLPRPARVHAIADAYGLNLIDLAALLDRAVAERAQ